MEQGAQPPVFQKKVGDLILSPSLQAVKVPEGAAVRPVRLVDRQTEREHVDRVGIEIPVLHQQRASVRLVLGEQLDHLLGSPILAEKDLQKSIIDRVGVFGDAGIDEGLQRLLQAKAVDIPLHIVRDLAWLQAFPQIDALIVLPRLFSRVEAELLAAVVQKAERGGFQVVSPPPVGIQRRLRGADVGAETRRVLFSHFFDCRISHKAYPPVSIKTDLNMYTKFY